MSTVVRQLKVNRGTAAPAMDTITKGTKDAARGFTPRPLQLGAKIFLLEVLRAAPLI